MEQRKAVPGSAAAVLVVDDSRAQRQILSMQLRRWGYRVTEAKPGAAALQVCAAGECRT